MSTFFENQYQHTREYFKEYFSYFFFKKPIRITLNIIFSFYAIAGILSLFPSAPFFYGRFGWWSALLSLFYWAVISIQYFRAIKIQLNRELEINHGELFEVKLTVTNDEIASCYIGHEPGSTIQVTNIKRVAKTKNYYILVTRARLCLVFKKDSFFTGKSEDFLPFLRSKGLKC